MTDVEEREQLLQAQIDRLDAVATLQRSKGWKHLLDYFQKIKDNIVNTLLVEQDSTKIIQLQERYRAYNEMLEAVTVSSQERERLAQELQNLIEERQYREDYALT